MTHEELKKNLWDLENLRLENLRKEPENGMTHEKLKEKALARPEVRQEYEALQPEFQLLRRMLQARQQAGLTQEEVAERMGTKRSAVARLETMLSTGKHSPSIATLQRYAQAVGSKLDIYFVPE